MHLDFDLVWGGYYAHKEFDSKEYSITRILDFNIDSYHTPLFNENFTTPPSPNIIDKLEPFVYHIPIDTKALLLHTQEFILIDRRALKPDDLEGYRYYLQDAKVPQKDIDELINKLINFSKNEPPLPIRMYLKDNELQIEPR